MGIPAKPSGPVANFISRVQSANNRKSTQVVLSMQESIDLSAALSQMLVRENSLLNDIVELQKNRNVMSEVQMDGGGFK